MKSFTKNRLLIFGCLVLAGCKALPIERFNVLPTLESNDAQPIINSINPKDLYSDEGLINLYEAINPGVAAIIVYSDDQLIGQGSGFLFDDQGHVLTNYHVVENAELIEVVFPNGYRGYGELIGSDLDSDIAVIGTNVSNELIKPIPLGNSADVRVGQSAVAIGNPYG